MKDTHTALMYELAFTVTRSVSGQSCEVKQHRARLVTGWVTQALEQGARVVALMFGTMATTMVSEVFDELMQGQL